jgi:TP901-1 family phage major tail protein
MTAQKGKDLLVKIADGAGYTTVAGLRTRRLAFNAETVDITHAESANRWRELLDGAGVKRASVSGRGLFKDASTDALMRQTFFDGAVKSYQIVVPDFGTTSYSKKGLAMFATILGWLGNLLGGPFAKAAVDAYRAKLTAENTSEKIAADLAARELGVAQRERELAMQVVVTEQGRWFTALPRPLFAFAFVIYVWKVVVWDKVFGLGTTDVLGGDVAQWAMIVLAAYFGGRSIEKVAKIISRK